jgi:hypothetical protein
MACLTNYTVQCRDVTTGKTGCFLYDTEHWQRTGEFKATTPIFGDLDSFFAWDRQNGNKCAPCYLERLPG